MGFSRRKQFETERVFEMPDERDGISDKNPPVSI